MDNPYSDSDYVGEFNILAMERSVVIDALKKSNGCIRHAANMISGMTERTLFRKLNRHSLHNFAELLRRKSKTDLVLSYGQVDKELNRTLKHEFLMITVEKILQKSNHK